MIGEASFADAKAQDRGDTPYPLRLGSLFMKLRRATSRARGEAIACGRTAVSTAMSRKVYCPWIVPVTPANYREASANDTM